MTAFIIVYAVVLGCLISQTIGVESLPDFVMDEAQLNNIAIRTEYFPEGDCQINEGCVKCAGERTVLRFVTEVANIGTSQFYVGPPQDSPLAEYDECHGHYHLSEYNEYLVFKASDEEERKPLEKGGKEGMCVQDGTEYSGYDPTIYNISRAGYTFRNCSNQGIGIGRSDIYSNHIVCQFVDITDLKEGEYVLRYVMTLFQCVYTTASDQHTSAP